MRIPLLKASFIGGKKNLRGVIETLKGSSAFQMTVFKKVNPDAVGQYNNEYDQLMLEQRRLKNVIEFAKVRGGKSAIEYGDLKAFAQYRDEATTIVEDLEQKQAKINQIKTEIDNNVKTVQELKSYWNLPIPFNMLAGTKSVFILCGIMPNNKFEQYRRDFASSKIAVQGWESAKSKKCVVVTCHRDDAPIAEVIHQYDFQPCHFEFDQNAQDATKTLLDKNVVLQEEYKFAREHVSLTPEETRVLQNYYDYVTNEIDTANLESNTLQTRDYYVLNGWIIASHETQIRASLEKSYPDVMMRFEQPADTDEAPVLIKNSKIVTPFQNVTNMYGQPSNTDIDPNPFVAIFFFIFFGMMVGDMGYALVLTVACAAFIYFKKPLNSTKQFILLFAIGGVSAIAWGIFYGSIFGFSIPSRVIDPIDGAIYLLLLSLGLGLFQLLVGICLGFYRNVVNKKYWDAFLDSLPRIILFVGLFMFLPTAAFGLFKLAVYVPFLETISTPGMYIALAGAGLIVLFNGRKKRGILGKITGGLAGAYGLINYFNDVISYVRLFALALVGAVLAGVANTMAGILFGIPIVGYPAGILVAVAFHAFNLGLGLLSAYVHGARLHFIEFFSKFYSGEGTAFKPIGNELKFNYIKGGN